MLDENHWELPHRGLSKLVVTFRPENSRVKALSRISQSREGGLTWAANARFLLPVLIDRKVAGFTKNVAREKTDNSWTNTVRSRWRRLVLDVVKSGKSLAG